MYIKHSVINLCEEAQINWKVWLLQVAFLNLNDQFFRGKFKKYVPNS